MIVVNNAASTEPDVEELLWGQVNLFRRTAAWVERLLDDNEVA